MEQEKRIYTLSKLEVRQGDEAETPKIEGHAAVFNARSVNLGGFHEEIKPGAFKNTLSRRPDVRATIDHDGGVQTLGRTKSRTLALSEDSEGLKVLINPPDTQAARDIMTLIERGDIDQMSFMFRVPTGGDEWRVLDDGTTLRTLNTIDLEDGDVSIVTYPAYPQTSVEARNKAKAMSSQVADTPDDDEQNVLQVQAEARQREIEIKRKKYHE